MRTPSLARLVIIGCALAGSAMAGCASAPREAGLGERAGAAGRATDAIAHLLALVPDIPGALDIVTATDYARARSEVSAGPPPTDTAALTDWYRTTERDARWWPVAFGGGHADVEGWRRSLGFSIVDVEAAIEVGVAPDELRAYRGVVGPTIDAATSSDPVWSQRLVRTVRPAGTLHDWGDGADPDDASAARLAGEGGQLLVDDEVAVRTSRRAVLDMVIAAGTETPHRPSDGTGSLADRADVQAVLQVMDRHRVYSLLLSDASVSGEEEFYWSDRASDASRRRWSGFDGSAAFLEPYSLIGVGLARDAAPTGVPDDAPVFLGVIVIAHDDSATATANADNLRRNLEFGSSFRTGQYWRDVLRIRSVAAAGVLTVAVVEPATADGPAQAWLQRDSLFWVPYTL